MMITTIARASVPGAAIEQIVAGTCSGHTAVAGNVLLVCPPGALEGKIIDVHGGQTLQAQVPEGNWRNWAQYGHPSPHPIRRAGGQRTGRPRSLCRFDLARQFGGAGQRARNGEDGGPVHVAVDKLPATIRRIRAECTYGPARCAVVEARHVCRQRETFNGARRSTPSGAAGCERLSWPRTRG